MKKITEKHICMIPVVLWIVIIPLIVKVKFFKNPLADYSWYSSESALADFFLYYKSVFITVTGILMLILLAWQINKMQRKNRLINGDMRIFIPIIIYLVLVIFSSLFSKFGYFCIHGMPDQFETVWNLIAYVIALFYLYYMVVYHNSEKSILFLVFIGATLVGMICVLQYLKIDIYRLIYAGEGYSFTFEEGTVYGPFYNTNYVGYYTLLFAPLFLMLCICYKDWKIRIASGILACALLVSMYGARSDTAEIVMGGVLFFAILFVLLKNVRTKKILWLPIAIIIVGGVGGCMLAAPRFDAYVKSTNIEKRDLENIFTNDDNVEIDYQGKKLYIQMYQDGDLLTFVLKDQDQEDVAYEYMVDDGYYCYVIKDDRFKGITLTPVVITDDPVTYGFVVQIDDKNWCFTNQMMEDGTYYYYNDLKKLTKLTDENVSADFAPLVDLNFFATGRGYIWNKTIPLLKDYIFLGSGPDTYALVFPNDDYVDRYNNYYGNAIITKPHNLYLQIAVQTGVLSLICFLVFYVWYFISSLRIYFKQRLDNPLVIAGFAVMLGTLGYMVSGMLNDSTVTITPLYWAMLGMGIGINHRIKMFY